MKIIHNTFQDTQLSMFSTGHQIDAIMKLKKQEAQAMSSPGKKVKIVAGMYFYLPVNGNAVFTISTYGDDYPASLKSMWRVESAEGNTEGDYGNHYTLKDAITSLESM